MAQMATIPVFACRYCGKPVYITHLSTVNDPDASKLKAIMQSLSQIALCAEHRAKYNWLAKHGLEKEMMLNPHVVIYNVLDHSGVDYYRKKG